MTLMHVHTHDGSAPVHPAMRICYLKNRNRLLTKAALPILTWYFDN
jgi:hypothetical protein